MVDVEVQTAPPAPAMVVGVQQDVMIGVRVRKSFGARAFWGSVVGCYWVSGGLFYKVSFDDGDVDVFSADEVLQDAQAAKAHAKENAQADSNKAPSPGDDYVSAMRQNSLKRKREDVADNVPPNVRRVQLWGQRLYASIYTNEKNETFIKELLKTDSGQVGEMESSGKVLVGDMILAVNQTRVLGLPSKDLADLIRKPKRPITLSFYRPIQQQPGVTQAPEATTEQAQQQQPARAVPPTQPAAQHQAPAPAAVIPTSFIVPQPAFAQLTPMSQGMARQWTQLAQPQGLSNREIIRQRLAQNMAARQVGFVTGNPMGVHMPGNVAPAQFVVPPAHGGTYQTQHQQYMQRIVDTAAMRVTSGFNVPAGQRAKPMPQPQSVAPVSSSGYNAERNQRQRTLYEQAQQLHLQRNSTPSERTQSNGPPPTAGTRTNGAQDGRFSILSQGIPERRTGSSQPTNVQQNVPASSQQSANLDATRDRRSAETPRARASISAVVSSGNSAATSSSFNAGAAAVAVLAEKDPRAAKQALEDASRPSSFLPPSQPSAEVDPQHAAFDVSQTMSFLSPNESSAAKDPHTAERATQDASHSMSFLSPNDFNVESSMPSRRELSAATAIIKSEAVASNVSIVTVKVHRHRLYLTLGVQGTLVAVTSFVADESGGAGEVEASGQVFLGDVLVRVNETSILPGLTPGDVAQIVTTASRPMTLWFERASWDILDGKE